MIKRTLTKPFHEQFFKGKALILLGPRQVGKTTLINEILDGDDFLFLDGDDPSVRALLTQAGAARLSQIIGGHKIIFIDEAQRIPDIGQLLKIIADQFKSVQLIVSGSSSFEITDAANEPLTGRKFEYLLFPISWEEYEQHAGFLAAEQTLNHRLIYGMYPDVLNHYGDEERFVLHQLAQSYLYRDVLSLTGIRKPELLEKLLRALALQLGSEVSYNELSGLVGADKNTLMRYIRLLEQSFIIFQLNPFSGNLRNEIKSNRKIYFYDNGIRNVIINNLNPLELRTDKGALWENFLISERFKQNAYYHTYANHYFWRNTQKQEIDFVEEKNGSISAFEFKWKSGGRNKIPGVFLKQYEATGKTIDRENFRDFVIIKGRNILGNK